jgi:hypothetical protein
MKPLVRAGDVIQVPDEHYLYGTETLTLRVTRVLADLERRPGPEWIRLRGVEIRWDGSEASEREVLVRAGALRIEGVVRRTDPN